MPRIPADVPLAWLSTRSLMDYCMGLGQWKYARDATALTLADLPLLQSDPAAQEQVQATLATRDIPLPRFLQWYNACTRAAWPECRSILAAQPLGTIPPFVLQRALHRISGAADAASAVELVRQHIPTYSVSESQRLCLLLLTTCIHRHKAWHVSRPLAACVLDTVHRWLAKPDAQRTTYASTLLETAWTGWLAGMPDPRACEALQRVWDVTHAKVPSAAEAMETFVCQRTASRHSIERIPTSVIQAWLPTAIHKEAFLHLAARVAAVHGDTDVARACYERLHGAPGATSSFLRALALSSSQADLREAWSLFDAMMTHAPQASSTHIPDWIVMLRAAAADARIPVHRVVSLLQMQEETEVHDAPWNVPPSVQAQLAQSVAAHTALVEGLLERGDVSRAWGVWDAMVHRGVAPDVWALKTLCRLYFEAGYPVRALECVMHWCHRGVRLPAPRAGVVRMHVPKVQDLGQRAMRVDQTPSSRHVVRLRPTTHLANTLLLGLYRARAWETLMLVWHALQPTLHVQPDTASIDLMLRAARAEAQASQAPCTWAPAARVYFVRLLTTQHPELQACMNPLEAPGRRGWIVRSELQLRRWERWMEGRLRRLWRGAADTLPPVTISTPLPHVCLDARVFHHYAELVLTLMEVDFPGASRATTDQLWEELFLIAAWMRALDVTPMRETLCLWCSVHDERLPPAASTMSWRTWLAQWLGEASVPSDAELGAWYRAHRARID